MRRGEWVIRQGEWAVRQGGWVIRQGEWSIRQGGWRSQYAKNSQKRQKTAVFAVFRQILRNRR
jgi:hypothetical protein